MGYDFLTLDNIRSAGNLSQNTQKAVIATCICFLTKFYIVTTNEHTGQLLVGPNALCHHGSPCVVLIYQVCFVNLWQQTKTTYQVYRYIPDSSECKLPKKPCSRQTDMNTHVNTFQRYNTLRTHFHRLRLLCITRLSPTFRTFKFYGRYWCGYTWATLATVTSFSLQL